MFNVITCSVSLTDKRNPYIPIFCLCVIVTTSSSRITSSCLASNPNPSLLRTLYTPLLISVIPCTTPDDGANLNLSALGLNVINVPLSHLPKLQNKNSFAL